jgi:Fanconi anemia group M protein
MYEQSSENKSKAVKQITKNPEFNKAYIDLMELSSKKIEHPKLSKLKEIICDSIKENTKTKIIIFSQYRETALIISKILNTIEKVNSKVFVGQNKKGKTWLSQKEQKEIIEEFKKGAVNIICATSIGEEGLDIPEVNAVIFYEPIPSAIRKIQRAGRTARLMKGKLIILVTKKTLDEIFYFASRSKEKRMYKSLESVKKDLEDGMVLNKKDNFNQIKLQETMESEDMFQKKLF